jgi:hypothetical protein
MPSAAGFVGWAKAASAEGPPIQRSSKKEEGLWASGRKAGLGPPYT